MVNKKEEEDFTDWLEGTIIVDDEGKPIIPKLVEDVDEGEDTEEDI